MSRKLYTFLFSISLPFLFLRLLWRSRKIKSYRLRLKERLGIFQAPEHKNGFWFHAVSVGETNAAIPVIQQILHHYPKVPITVTTTTPTGSERVRQVLKEQVFHVYLPFDLPFAINNFITRIRPKLCIILETELWPNLFYSLSTHHIPILLINGRLSLNSTRGYHRIRPMVHTMFSQVAFVGAQSNQDTAHFQQLGCPDSKLHTLGNVKFDIQYPEALKIKSQILREQLGQQRFIWIAASTHPKEEQVILQSFKTIKQKIPTSLLIIVPRHPDRFEEVASLITDTGFTIARRNLNELPKPTTDVYLGDTMGELLLFYGACDCAFVGGSLTPIGGHNVLEAASICLPTVVGPHLHNFLEISEKMLQAKALVKVTTTQELTQTIIDWYNNPTERKAMGKRGYHVIQANQGAVQKIIQVIEQHWQATCKHT